MRALIANARRSIFLPLSALLISLGALFFVLPTFTAYAFGVLVRVACPQRLAGGVSAEERPVGCADWWRPESP